MKLTPLDIRRQEFKRVVRGIDPEEVSVFLDMVAGEYERIIRENKALSEERDELKRKVDELDSMREAIQGAVVLARKSSDEVMGQAKKEAELRLKEAEVESERMLEEARRKASLIKRELDDVRNQRAILVGRLKSLLEGQMKMLEAYVGDWGQDDSEMDRSEGTIRRVDDLINSDERRRKADFRRFEDREPAPKREQWAPEMRESPAQPRYSEPVERADSSPPRPPSPSHEEGLATERPEKESDGPIEGHIPPPFMRDPGRSRSLDESVKSYDPPSGGGQSWERATDPGAQQAYGPLKRPTFLRPDGPDEPEGGLSGEGRERGAPEGGGEGNAWRPGSAYMPRIRELTPRQDK